MMCPLLIIRSRVMSQISKDADADAEDASFHSVERPKVLPTRDKPILCNDYVIYRVLMYHLLDLNFSYLFIAHNAYHVFELFINYLIKESLS